MFTGIENQEYLFSLIGTLAMIAIVFLALALMLKLQQIKQLSLSVVNLRKSLDEMDEQAKLIVRTDLELNKTHEELDKRINCLYALQRISQDLSNTLDQTEIFRRIKQENIQEIGFSKVIVFNQNASGDSHIIHQIGFNEDGAALIETGFIKEGICQAIRRYGHPVSAVSLAAKDSRIASSVSALSRLDSWVIAPISKKDGFYGFILLGNESNESPLSEGDEELVSILATHIAQALDNAELFENAYSQHQELEKKVIARTKELSDALDQIKAISKRKSDFVSSVSHELRTPLTSIKGYASILLSEKLGAVSEQIKERLAKINKHSDELVRMINDLLDIARIESGRFEMKPETQHIPAVVEAVIDLLAPQLKEKAVSWEINLPGTLSPVLADRSQLPRVFINLLGNAIKFVPQNSGTIKISCLEHEDTVQINISDNGIGMSPQDAGHIFEEFYRVDNVINQKVKGTGLGLTLVKNIIQAHQGKIWVESQLNQGSTFSFILPKAR